MMRDIVRCIKLLLLPPPLPPPPPPLLLPLLLPSSLFTWSHIATEYPAATNFPTCTFTESTGTPAIGMLPLSAAACIRRVSVMPSTRWAAWASLERERESVLVAEMLLALTVYYYYCRGVWRARWGSRPVEHLVEVTHLEHEDMLWLRLLQLCPLVHQPSLRGGAVLGGANAATAAEIRPRQTRAQSREVGRAQQQRRSSRHEI